MLGIGLAANGIIDVRRGVILHYDLVPAATDLPLRDLVAAETGLPCCMENNIRVLTLAEWMSGAAQHLDSFVCLAVRSGVGAGIVIDGKLFGGQPRLRRRAGLHAGDARAGRAAVEAPAGRGVRERAGRRRRGRATSLSARARPASGRADRCAQLATMAALLDPQAIVLAGGLLRPDRPLWDAMVRVFRQMVFPELADRVQILPARLGPFAAAMGAAHRCFEMLYPLEPTPV